MKPIILFDLDGTLIDSTEAILESFHHSLSTLGHPRSVADEEIKALIGHPLDVMFAQVGCDPVKIEGHVLTYKEYYREISCQKTVLLPYAKEAIAEAVRYARLGIVTTKTARYSRELMEHFGVMEHFEVLIGYESVRFHKPHPEPIHRALEEMKAQTDKVWMIGDTRLDVEAAHRAGIGCVAVTSGYDKIEQLSTLTDIIEPNALEAVRFIGKRALS